MTSSLFIDETRLTGLRTFGYSQAESAFLTQVAHHGGHFLRRQFVHVAGEDDSRVDRLIDKLVAKNHVSVTDVGSETRVYHLASRAIYRAIGQEHSRNRRARPALAVKARVMELDFVLHHPAVTFLATATDKTAFFVNDMGLPLTSIPAKRFGQRDSDERGIRYFVDGQPIFLDHGSDAGIDVGFGFVDPGATTVSGFETYLAQYSPLLASVDRFTVVYIASTPRLFRAAERAFERTVNRMDGSVDQEGHPALREYFELRERFERGERHTFDREQLLRLRDLRDQFRSSGNDARFVFWQRQRTSPHASDDGPNVTSESKKSRQFRTCFLEYDYAIFGNLTAF